jgi:hypothetical protein
LILIASPVAGLRPMRAVELGAAYCNGSAVRQGHRTAGCINGNDELAFRHQIRFDQQFDLAHARTTALGAANVKRIARLQSRDRVTSRINSTQQLAPNVAHAPKVSGAVCRNLARAADPHLRSVYQRALSH